LQFPYIAKEIIGVCLVKGCRHKACRSTVS